MRRQETRFSSNTGSPTSPLDGHLASPLSSYLRKFILPPVSAWCSQFADPAYDPGDPHKLPCCGELCPSQIDSTRVKCSLRDFSLPSTLRVQPFIHTTLLPLWPITAEPVLLGCGTYLRICTGHWASTPVSICVRRSMRHSASAEHWYINVGKPRTTEKLTRLISGTLQQHMQSTTSSSTVTAPLPGSASMTAFDNRDLPSRPSISPSISSNSSSSDSDVPQPLSSRTTSRRTRMDRPRIGDRQRSNTHIVPKGRDIMQTERPEYPPDDARAMSPRRNSADIEKLERGLRESLKE